MNTTPSDRARLRDLLVTAIKAAYARPRWGVAEKLADKLMPTIRQAQADAWTRGWAAGALDHSDRLTRRRNPYMGGRHAGTVAPPVAPPWRPNVEIPSTSWACHEN